jgi:hypothetical protein
VIDERAQQRKFICEVFEDTLEVSLQARHSRSSLCIAPLAPLGELSGDHFLNGFAVGKVRCTTGAAPDEVVFAERETRGKIGRFDQSADVHV